MLNVIAAVAATLVVPTGIAARIVTDNAHTLAQRRIPADVIALGYVGADGSDLMLATSDARVICELRISSDVVDAIALIRTN